MNNVWFVERNWKLASDFFENPHERLAVEKRGGDELKTFATNLNKRYKLTNQRGWSCGKCWRGTVMCTRATSIRVTPWSYMVSLMFCCYFTFENAFPEVEKINCLMCPSGNSSKFVSNPKLVYFRAKLTIFLLNFKHSQVMTQYTKFCTL